MDITLLIFIFTIAAFLGKELISKTPSQLQAVQISITNAISGITLVGAIIVCAGSEVGSLSMILSFIAIILASINVIGGYIVTDRMSEMLQKKGDEE